MRTIKFRVWDKAINKMITQENVKKFLDEIISERWEDEIPYSSDEWYPAYEILTIFDYLKNFQERTVKRYEPSENRFDIMQYTGLHDKNGKEIYEGDIVKVRKWSSFETEIVKFDKGCFYAGMHYGSSTRTTLKLIQPKMTEVIGNIYENKELLNETNR